MHTMNSKRMVSGCWIEANLHHTSAHPTLYVRCEIKLLNSTFNAVFLLIIIPLLRLFDDMRWLDPHKKEKKNEQQRAWAFAKHGKMQWLRIIASTLCMDTTGELICVQPARTFSFQCIYHLIRRLCDIYPTFEREKWFGFSHNRRGCCT